MLHTLLQHVGRFKTASFLAPLFTALECVMGVLIPYVTSWIIDRGIMAGNMGNVYKYGLLLVVMAAFSMLFGILAGKFSALAASGFAYNLRDAMFKNIQTFSFSNIDKFSTAGLITRMTTDVTNLQSAFQMLMRASLRAPLNLVFSIFMCVFINARMSIIFIIALVVLGTVLYLIISRTVKLFNQVFQRYDDLNSSVQENVYAIRVVKAFVRENYENRKFSAAVNRLYNLFVKTETLMAINHPVMSFVVYGCIIALSWFGAKQIIVDNLTTGQLASLFTYVTTIMGALMMLSMIFVQLTMSAASGKRIAEVLDEKADVTNPENPLKEVADGSIDFNGVKFSYGNSNGEYAIRDIDLHIKSGETIGVIGGTGSGKSTLANLICRLYDVNEGSVCVGGHNVKEYDLESLRNMVSMVLQSNVLFTGTILDNLRWGKPDATEEECKEACRLACADEFIDQMPEGYNTKIEQNGTNVSGGQKQRLCIARALIKKPKILILDDSTSACDNITDAKIRQGFKTYIPETTKIIITQRISSIEDADRIIVMQSGRVTGFDTHDNLLKSNKLYQEIYNLQTQGDGDFDEQDNEKGGEA